MAELLPKFLGSTINLVSQFSPKFASKLAIKLFSTPRKGRLSDIEMEYLDRAFQEDVVIENISVRTYRWLGKKETILLTHGWESNAFRWKSLIDSLKTYDYNIIALDAPGHGNSSGNHFNTVFYSECIHAISKKFKVNIIIGHSIGGTAAIFSQYKYQLDSIHKMILLGIPADFTGVFKRYETLMGYNKKVSNAMAELVIKKHNNTIEYYSATNFSKEIKAKGLIIHDKKDRIIPYTDALKLNRSYENAKLISTKGFGHKLKSDLVYSHITTFLNA